MNQTAITVLVFAAVGVVLCRYARLYIRYRQAITLNKTYEDEIARLKEDNTKHVYHAEQVENNFTRKIDEVIFKRTH